MSGSGTFARLFEEYKAGSVTRRQFLARASSLGVGATVATFLASTHQVAGAPARPRAGAAVVAQAGTGAPAVGTEGRARGAGGELKLLQWQAPTTANGHVATGTKDQLAASLVLEPLMNYLPDGSLISKLITEVPTVENGMLKEDLTGVTFSLLPDVLWSDGTPFTAEDVVFTWNWIVVDFDTNSSASFNVWNPITNAVAVDPLTVEITFANPNVAWYAPFSGTTYGFILPKHILEAGPDAATAFGTAPIGTGPYVIESFTVNDQIVARANPNYREPSKPFFETINLKGGGDAASAARAVLQTGDWDFAWNLQVEPAVLNDLIGSAQAGEVVVAPGASVERININFSDPNTEVNGERSQKDTPHPFLSDPVVRQAMSMAVDRDTISTQFYGEGEPGTANFLTGVPAWSSTNTSYTYDLEAAKQLLDEAGWVMDGDTRSKDGVELKVTYSTTINAVRQKTQAVVKQGFEEIGIGVSLQQIDSGIFFDGSPGNEQNASHMYVDINMFTNGATEPTPVSYMATLYAGPDGANISQASNNWLGSNNLRWANAEYDALYEQLRSVTDLESAASLLVQMNDIIIREIAVIPQVHRSADKYAISNRLVKDNVAVSAFDYSYWNIANWVTVE